MAVTTSSRPGQTAEAPFDELLHGGPAARGQWARVLGALEALGAAELGQRFDEARSVFRNARRHERQSGVEHADRLPELDPYPLVLGEADWAVLEAGARQLARLREALMRDLYGPQRLLRAGLIPPGAVYGNPRFLRPCHGTAATGGVFLRFQAFEVSRAPDGTWRLRRCLSDVVSGLGRTMECRLALLRQLPETLHECHVRRLLPFFSRITTELHAALPKPREHPRVAILSRGPDAEDAHELANLAAHLGVALLEGSDLAVRDGALFVKTLAGLLPVDALIRQVPDIDCDPLELDYASEHGVPGLVQAAHEGTILLANALGAGALEDPRIDALLPELCLEVLGEQCLLAPDAGAPMSLTPSWEGGAVIGRPVALRLFAHAAGGGYDVLPGALGFIHGAQGIRLALKDVWVLSDRPEPPRTLLSPGGPPVALRRSGLDLPSRIADDFFWLGRYVERLDGFSRLLRNGFRRLASEEATSDLPEMAALLQLLRNAGLAVRPSLQRMDEGELEDLLLRESFAPSEGHPLHASLDGLGRIARRLRDRLGADAFRTLELIAAARPAFAARPPASTADAIEVFDNLVQLCAGLHGYVAEGMTRGPSWRFLDMGIRIERALRSVATMRSVLDAPGEREAALLAALLEFADSILTHRLRYGPRLEPAGVVDLLLHDDTNPRSTAYQLLRLREHLQALSPTTAEAPQPRAELRLATRLVTTVETASVQELCAVNGYGHRVGLGQVLDEVSRTAGQLAYEVERRYFRHHADGMQAAIRREDLPT
ncbi:MAG: circularly permuted type 2 ATP-grasp protein [Candidatus Sumerlaeia bacterium]|nr:circularly permuted type 2 ATP-grasp protein [Candidatus Sumerlaeia bacterium]